MSYFLKVSSQGNLLDREKELNKSGFNIFGKWNYWSKRPERNNVGINNNLSIDDAFSVQKHRHATIDWIKNWIKKDKKVDITDKNKIPKFGIHILSGLKIKKKDAINRAKGNLVNCSARCCAKYLKNGFKGCIK